MVTINIFFSYERRLEQYHPYELITIVLRGVKNTFKGMDFGCKENESKSTNTGENLRYCPISRSKIYKINFTLISIRWQLKKMNHNQIFEKPAALENQSYFL